MRASLSGLIRNSAQLKSDLNGVMELSRRDAARVTRVTRWSGHVRLALAAIVSIVMFQISDGAGWSIILSIYVGLWAAVFTLNDWSTMAYILAMFTSDQALALHDAQSESLARIGEEILDRCDVS